MKIALASDHAGYELKEAIKAYLGDHEVTDFGTHDTSSMNYPDTGFAASCAVAAGDYDRGILVCGSGIGMSIVANKVAGVRAALCHCTDFARLSRLHNNANVLVLPGRFISHYLAKEMLEIWLSTAFEGGRHQNRLDIISDYEQKEK